MQPDFWNDKRPAGVPNDVDMGGFRSVVEAVSYTHLTLPTIYSV